MSLYQQALGADFAQLPLVLQKCHAPEDRTIEGTLSVRWSRYRILRFFLHCCKMPKEAAALPCTVHMQKTESIFGNGAEWWQRSIGQTPLWSRMRSKQSPYIEEQIGLCSIILHTEAMPWGLRQRSTSVTFLGLRIPGLQIWAREVAIDQHSYFCDVKLLAPLVGCILHYRGRLQPLERN